MPEKVEKALRKKISITEDYIGISSVKPRRSISESRLDDEEFEEISDNNYVFSKEEWDDVLQRDKNKLSKEEEERLACSIKVGLPKNLRGQIWEYLVRASKYKSKSSSMYQNYLNKPNDKSTDWTISKDILRTFPKNEKYKEDFKSGENKLFNVLRAYSTYDEDVKYCQGMNFIVFLFLQNCDDDEERAFWLLVSMMKHLKWRKLYKIDTPKLIKILEKLKKRMKKEIEDVYEHLIAMELPIEGMFAPYFITLFLYSTPMNIAERIID